MNERDYEKQQLAIAQEQYEAGKVLRGEGNRLIKHWEEEERLKQRDNQKHDWKRSLCGSDFETIVLALEREHSSIVELLNSGRVVKNDQDKLLRERDYKIEELLKRLGVNP